MSRLSNKQENLQITKTLRVRRDAKVIVQEDNGDERELDMRNVPETLTTSTALQAVATLKMPDNHALNLAESTTGAGDGSIAIFRASDKSTEVTASPSDWVVPDDRLADGSEGAWELVGTAASRISTDVDGGTTVEEALGARVPSYANIALLKAASGYSIGDYASAWRNGVLTQFQLEATSSPDEYGRLAGVGGDWVVQPEAEAVQSLERWGLAAGVELADVLASFFSVAANGSVASSRIPTVTVTSAYTLTKSVDLDFGGALISGSVKAFIIGGGFDFTLRNAVTPIQNLIELDTSVGDIYLEKVHNTTAALSGADPFVSQTASLLTLGGLTLEVCTFKKVVPVLLDDCKGGEVRVEGCEFTDVTQYIMRILNALQTDNISTVLFTKNKITNFREGTGTTARLLQIDASDTVTMAHNTVDGMGAATTLANLVYCRNASVIAHDNELKDIVSADFLIDDKGIGNAHYIDFRDNGLESVTSRGVVNQQAAGRCYVRSNKIKDLVGPLMRVSSGATVLAVETSIAFDNDIDGIDCSAVFISSNNSKDVFIGENRVKGHVNTVGIGDATTNVLSLLDHNVSTDWASSKSVKVHGNSHESASDIEFVVATRRFATNPSPEIVSVNRNTILAPNIDVLNARWEAFEAVAIIDNDTRGVTTRLVGTTPTQLENRAGAEFT